MKRIDCGRTIEINTTPKDGIIGGCYQCPHALNKADAPWDTVHIWKCQHPDNKYASDVIRDGKGFLKGCPIKAEMFKKKPSLKKLYRVPKKTPFEKWLDTNESNAYSNLHVAFVSKTKQVIAAHKELHDLQQVVRAKYKDETGVVYGKVPYKPFGLL